MLDEDLIGLDFDEPTKQDTFKVIYKEYIDKTVSEDDVLAKFKNSEDDEESFFPVEGEFALKFEKKNAPMYSWSYVFGMTLILNLKTLRALKNFREMMIQIIR